MSTFTLCTLLGSLSKMECPLWTGGRLLSRGSLCLAKLHLTVLGPVWCLESSYRCPTPKGGRARWLSVSRRLPTSLVT